MTIKGGEYFVTVDFTKWKMQLQTRDPGFKHGQYSLPRVDQFWPLPLLPNATLSVAMRDGHLSIFQVGRTRNRASNKASKQASNQARPG